MMNQINGTTTPGVSLDSLLEKQLCGWPAEEEHSILVETEDTNP